MARKRPLALTYEEAKESVAVDRKVAKAGQMMISQIIFTRCPEVSLRIIGYLEIIFPGIQVDRVATALNTAADED